MSFKPELLLQNHLSFASSICLLPACMFACLPICSVHNQTTFPFGWLAEYWLASPFVQCGWSQLSHLLAACLFTALVRMLWVLLGFLHLSLFQCTDTRCQTYPSKGATHLHRTLSLDYLENFASFLLPRPAPLVCLFRNVVLLSPG